MQGYTEACLRQARQPFRDLADRDHAACVLGHLEVEEREQPTAERAADIRAISAAVQSFDMRAKVTAGAAPPVPAAAVAPIAAPAQLAPPPASAPRATPPQPAASLQAPRRPTLGAGRIDLLSAGEPISRAPGPVDIVADMKRRHGIPA